MTRRDWLRGAQVAACVLALIAVSAWLIGGLP